MDSQDDPGPEIIEIATLRPGVSPRLAGENMMHVNVLAASESELPPILVHRPTMRVIDGMHRLRAAQQRGRNTIAVRFFDGSDAAAFAMAVKENTTHGLPLSTPDRQAAAIRLIASHPGWSDRMIAATTGLSATTVRSLRCSSAHLNSRVGRDGRVRPLDASDGRRRAGEFLTSKPDATVREIAAVAGISVGTASDVSRRVRAGLDPLLPRQRSSAAEPPRPSSSADAVHRQMDGRAWPDIRRSMSIDPSIRLVVTGRQLLQWLDAHALDQGEWDELADALPLHWADTIADQMLDWAVSWRELSDRIRRSSAAAS